MQTSPGEPRDPEARQELRKQDVPKVSQTDTTEKDPDTDDLQVAQESNESILRKRRLCRVERVPVCLLRLGLLHHQGRR